MDNIISLNVKCLIFLTWDVATTSFTSSSKTQDLIIIESADEPIYQPGQAQVHLSCIVTGKPSKQSSVTWMKNAVPLVGVGGTGSRLTLLANHTLVIRSPEISDAGLYTAVFSSANRSRSRNNCSVRFLAKPVVEEFSRGINHILGERLELRCGVKGYPVWVTWTRDDLNLSSLWNDTRVSLAPRDGVEDVDLFISDLTLSDSGTYTCHVSSEVFNVTVSKSVRIRVTDTSAAMLPFLAIVAEVVLVCSILFLYEKHQKRKRKRLAALYQHRH